MRSILLGAGVGMLAGETVVMFVFGRDGPQVGCRAKTGPTTWACPSTKFADSWRSSRPPSTARCWQITGSIEPQDARDRVTDGLFSQFSASPIIEFTDNIRDTKIWGGEVDFIYYVNDNWRLSGFYAYLDSEIGPHLEVVRGHPNPETGTWNHIDFNTGEPTTSVYVLPTDMTGNQLPMQPNHKFALTASYETPLSGAIAGNLQVLGTYSWVDERASDLSNFDVSTLPAYGRLDVRGTWTSPDEAITTSLFVQNVFDEIGVIEYLHLSTIAGAPASGTLTEPRSIGLEVRWRPGL